MPKAPSAETVRERAQARALKTVQTVIDSPVPIVSSVAVYNEQDAPQPEPVMFGKQLEELNEETPLTETQEAVQTQQPEPEEKPKRQYKKRGSSESEGDATPKHQSTHRGLGEDFMEYQARISPNDWASGLIYGNYIYKLLDKGKRRRIEQVIKQPITMPDLKAIAEEYGPGSYAVQFQSSLPHITSCTETYTFDDEGKATQGKEFSKQDPEGMGYTMKIASDITKDAAKAAVEMVKENQSQNNKQPDMGALLTGVANLLAASQPKHEPKEDKTVELIVLMLTNQAKDAERRADESEKRAAEQRRLDREDADRRERAAKEDATAARERDNQFFQLMLKQAETKADSLNQMTGLLTSFMKVKETIDDTMGGGPKGWMDVAGNVIDGVLQQGPAIVAAIKGAPPQQVAQMQNPQPQANEPQPFHEMLIRIAKYLQRDPQNYSGPYILDMIENEYGQVHVDLINQPKETILGAITAFEPFGKAIMEHPQASEFMGKIIDAIKFPDTMDDLFPEEPEEKEPIILHGKARKVNGRAKGAV